MISRLAGLALALLAVAAGPAPAEACSYFAPPGSRIEALQTSGRLRAILLVRVRDAQLLPPPLPDIRPWTAEADLVRPLRGSPPDFVLRFGRSGDGATCDDAEAVPGPGVLWVLYLADNGRGGVSIRLSYPLAVARRADPQLEALLPRTLSVHGILTGPGSGLQPGLR